MRCLLVVLVVAACANDQARTPAPTTPAVSVPEIDAEEPVSTPPLDVEPAVPSAPARAFYQPRAIDIEVRGAGRPIIFIPGLGCEPSIFETTIDHLKGFEAHLVSFAGYAGKKPIKGPLLATAREDIVAYVKDHKLDHPILVGHSLGGFMAFWLAVSEPELFGGLVNLDATPNFYSDMGSANIRQKADAMLAQGKAEFVDGLRNYYNPMSKDRRRMDAVIEQVIKSDQKAFVESFVEMSRVDLVPKMGTVTIPVLSVLSDGQYFFEYVKQQLAKVPKSKVIMLKDTRHFVFFDDPNGYFRALDSFLAELPPR